MCIRDREYIEELKAFAARQDQSAELEKLTQQIRVIESKKEKLLELTLAGALSNEEFKRRNGQYNDQLTGLEEERCV